MPGTTRTGSVSQHGYSQRHAYPRHPQSERLQQEEYHHMHPKAVHDPSSLRDSNMVFTPDSISDQSHSVESFFVSCRRICTTGTVDGVNLYYSERR